MRRFVIVCEGASDFRFASELADRLFKAAHDWLTDDSLPPEHDPLNFHRQWCGGDASFDYFIWDKIDDLSRSLGLPKLLGHFRGSPGELDASMTRQALFVLEQRFLNDPIHGVLLLRDGDDKSELRGQGINQAIDEARMPLTWKVISAVVQTKIECWILAGFIPSPNSDEIALLERMRGELGFNPVQQAELLTAKGKDDKKSAKRVLAVLTTSDVERQRECWTLTRIETLKENGRETGLKTFIENVEREWCPLFVRSA